MTVELVVSSGDPQGIGPEVSVGAAKRVAAGVPGAAVVLVGDRGVLARAGADPSWPAAGRGPSAPGVSVLDVPLPAPLPADAPSAAGGRAAVAALAAALRRVREGEGRALVTAPVSKAAVRMSDPSFDGHTGWLARELGVPFPVMMFVAPAFRVVLATVHVPISSVAGLVTVERLEKVVAVTCADLAARFGVHEPRIHVLGLNPHAGEQGGIGSEESRVVGPAIEDLRRRGFRIAGPFPADSYFRPGFEKEADVVVAWYHDQGLLPVKCLAFREAVNVTLGLPIVRTSVDHGTAFDLAWKGVADPRSMECACRLAHALVSATPG